MATVSPESRSHESSDSIPELLKELRDETTTLMRQEVALAKQELAEKVGKASRNAGYLIAGGVVAYAGVILVLAAVAALAYAGLVAAGVSHIVSGWLAPLLVGLLVAAVGFAFVQKAISTLSNLSVVPEKTVKSIQRDKELIKEKVTA